MLIVTDDTVFYTAISVIYHIKRDIILSYTTWRILSPIEGRKTDDSLNWYFDLKEIIANKQKQKGNIITTI